MCLPACSSAEDATSSTESNLTQLTLNPNEILAGLDWDSSRGTEYGPSRSRVANSYAHDESSRFAAFFFRAAAGDKPKLVIESPPDAQLSVWLLDSDFNVVPLTQETSDHGRSLYNGAYDYPLYTPFVANLTKSDTYYVVLRDAVVRSAFDHLRVNLSGDHGGVYGRDYGSNYGASYDVPCHPGSTELEYWCRYGQRCLSDGCYGNACTNKRDTNEKCHADLECASNQSCINGHCANPRIECSVGGGSASSGSPSSSGGSTCGSRAFGGVPCQSDAECCYGCVWSDDPRPGVPNKVCAYGNGRGAACGPTLACDSGFTCVYHSQLDGTCQ